MNNFSPNFHRWLKVRIFTEPQVLKRGGRGLLTVEINIPEGCHIEAHEPAEEFLKPTQVILDRTEGLAIGQMQYPLSEEKRFDWTDAVLRVYSGTIQTTAPIEVAADVKAGLFKISGLIKYQGCTESMCLQPASQDIEGLLEIRE